MPFHIITSFFTIMNSDFWLFLIQLLINLMFTGEPGSTIFSITNTGFQKATLEYINGSGYPSPEQFFLLLWQKDKHLGVSIKCSLGWALYSIRQIANSGGVEGEFGLPNISRQGNFLG